MATLYRASYSKRYNFFFLIALTIMLGLVVFFRSALPLIFVIAAMIYFVTRDCCDRYCSGDGQAGS